MALKTHITPALKWWWLILAATAVAAGSAFYITRDLPAVYRSSTTLLIGRSLFEANPNSTDFGLHEQLANVYITIAQREPVRQAVRESLGLVELPDYEVRTLGNGQFIEIAVIDVSPARAQAVASSLSDQLLRQTPGGLQGDVDGRDAFINAQLDDLQRNIAATLDEIAARQASLSEIVSAHEMLEAQDAITTLQARLTILQTNYANLLNNSQAGALNTLTVIEPAVLPVIPIGPNKLLLILLSGAGGLVLATAAAYLMEFLDDSMRSADEVVRVLHVPVIGSIGEIRKHGPSALVVDLQPDSVVTEAFRSLRTNLEFAGANKGLTLKTILVTSASSGEGKSTVAANLALLMAQGGRRVILVDADMRRPSLHTIFGIENGRGLSEVLQSDQVVAEVLRVQQGQPLWILTAGMPTGRSAELLASRRMEHVLASLEEMADVVIIDGPPCFLADAWILAAKASGVLCLLRLGSTSVRAAQAMLQQLERSGARLLGLALNRTTVQPAYYYGKYRPAQRAPGQRRPNDKAVQPSELGHQPSLGGGFIQRMRLKGPTVPPKTSPPPAVVEERKADRWSNPAYGMQHEGRLPVQATEHTEAVTDLVASQRALASMDLIASLGRDLGEGFEIEVLSQRVLQHTLQGLGASSGSLLVFDEAGTVAAGAVAYLGQVQSSTIKQLSEFVERGLAGWVLQHQEAVRIDSTRDDLRWLRRPWEEPDGASRSVISAPVIAHDRVAAVITLVHPRAGHFTSQDLALLKVVAACISFNGAPALRQAGSGPASGDA